MSALPQAFPLAVSAAIYPPALLVLLLLLTGDHPRRLVLAYFAGAVLMTVTAGLVALAVLHAAGATTQSSSQRSGWVYIGLGVILLVLAPIAWRRRGRTTAPAAAPESPAAAPESPAGAGRIATLTQRATASQRWSFVLGLAMFLPSPLYILAIKEISDSGDSSASAVLAVLICAVGVMLFVEIPMIALFVRPDSVASGMQRFDGWLKRNGWAIAAIVALIGGIYSIIKGIKLLG